MTKEKTIDDILEEARDFDYSLLADDREALEDIAKKTVSPANYYELVDCLEAMSEEELLKIISFDGDFQKEMKWIESFIESQNH